jgi:hypothetical protein
MCFTQCYHYHPYNDNANYSLKSNTNSQELQQLGHASAKQANVAWWPINQYFIISFRIEVFSNLLICSWPYFLLQEIEVSLIEWNYSYKVPDSRIDIENSSF